MSKSSTKMKTIDKELDNMENIENIKFDFLTINASFSYQLAFE